ncbi:MAG: hypothetical protein HYV90_01305 [Candidatus Woesebacteria bacterium]|nr:MAG: hypothetical protein HYV90_01305 [Candidatus Woesebacteria bacterium]
MSTNTEIASSWHKTPFRGFFYASLGLGFSSIAIIFIFKNILPPIVPLFYGRPFGESQLVPVLNLFFAPIVSIVITLTNSGLALITEDVFSKKILISGAFLFSLLITITILKIVFLVGFFG